MGEANAILSDDTIRRRTVLVDPDMGRCRRIRGTWYYHDDAVVVRRLVEQNAEDKPAGVLLEQYELVKKTRKR